jgi:hypothetical protein
MKPSHFEKVIGTIKLVFSKHLFDALKQFLQVDLFCLFPVFLTKARKKMMLPYK